MSLQQCFTCLPLCIARTKDYPIVPITWVGSQLLTMTVQLNVSYYSNKHDHSKSIHSDRLDICECQLVCLDLNDLAYGHSKTHLTEQSLSVVGCPPCIK